MTAEVIRDALTASPFVPFALRLADGRTFQVDHPDFVAIPPGRPRVIVAFTATDDPEHYRSHFLEVGLIAELVVDPTLENRGTK
jgi:hypothetical protein